MGARDLLADLAGAGLSVTAEGDRLVIRPASKLTAPMRAALRDAKSELLALLGGFAPEALDVAAMAWTDADIARFLDRRARLIRWGWTEPEAEKLAERLVKRDREEDDRVSCADCRHYRAGSCGNHKAAGLGGQYVGRQWAEILQRCPGFGSQSTAET